MKPFVIICALLGLAGCSNPSPAEEAILSGKFAKYPSSCGTNYLTFKDGEVTVLRHGKSVPLYRIKKVEALPGTKAGVGLSLEPHSEFQDRTGSIKAPPTIEAVAIEVRKDSIMPAAAMKGGKAIDVHRGDEIDYLFRLWRCET
jgi:hypothetical protein